MQSDPSSAKRKDPPSPPEPSTTAEPTPDIEHRPQLAVFLYLITWAAGSVPSLQAACAQSIDAPTQGREHDFRWAELVGSMDTFLSFSYPGRLQREVMRVEDG